MALARYARARVISARRRSDSDSKVNLIDSVIFPPTDALHDMSPMTCHAISPPVQG